MEGRGSGLPGVDGRSFLRTQASWWAPGVSGQGWTHVLESGSPAHPTGCLFVASHTASASEQ